MRVNPYTRYYELKRQRERPAPRLIQRDQVIYRGSFTVPGYDEETGGDLAFGHFGGITDGTCLYWKCFSVAWPYLRSVCKVSIPEIGGRAGFLQKPVKVGGDGGWDFQQINPGASDSDPYSFMPWGESDLIIAVASAYDANGTSQASHFKTSQLLTASALGPAYRIGDLNPGYYGGWMCPVPEEWRAAIGAPAVTGQGCLSIISRTSAGPSLFGFDPATMDPHVVPLLYYPWEHPFPNPQPEVVEQTMQIFGVAWVPQTKSVLFFGNLGQGPFCYGPADSLTPDDPCRTNPAYPAGHIAYDPTNANQGGHAYPYGCEVYAYAVEELLRVKAREIEPWEARPYATWPVLETLNPSGSSTPWSFAYNPAANRCYLHMEQHYGDCTVHVYDIDVDIEPVPPPVQQKFSGTVTTSTIPGLAIGDTFEMSFTKPATRT